MAHPEHRNDGRHSTPATDISINDIKFGADMPDELFNEIAKNMARIIAESSNKNNKATQLRKFYDELVMWHSKVYTEHSKDTRDAKYKELAPFIRMLNAKVAYAKGRKHVDSNFEIMFSCCISQINNAETLHHAKLFMEAFMGFYKAVERK